VDYGVIPGTKKPSLYKPGAEKLARLFQLGTRIVSRDKTVDPGNSFFMFSYTIEVYHPDTGAILAQCEGSANSQEKKYKNVAPADVLNTKYSPKDGAKEGVRWRRHQCCRGQ
jgi:hypothetical protein